MTTRRYKIDWLLSGIEQVYPNTSHADRMRFINAFLEFKLDHPAWVVGMDCAMPGSKDFMNAASGLFESMNYSEPKEIAMVRLRTLMIYLNEIQTGHRHGPGPMDHV